MSLCVAGRNFVEKGRLNLGNELDNVIGMIQSELFSQAQFANPSSVIKIRQGPYPQVIIPTDVRVIEVQETDLLERVPGYAPGTLRGVYIPQLGKILLNSRLWCIETLVHETLHATSIFSMREDKGQKHMLLVEGLTEFYTGYVLFKAFPDCYNTCWRKDSTSGCHCTYQPQVKIWSSLCHFLPIKETCRIYFWNGSTNWESEWASFIQSIRNTGYPEFQDILQGSSKILSWAYFHQECLKHLGKDYEKIYDSDEQSLDLSSIRV